MNSFSWRRVLAVTALVLVTAGLALGIYTALASRRAKIAYASWLADSHQSYWTCQQLPFYPEVQKAMATHADVIAKIKQLGGHGIQAVQIKCPDSIGSMYFIKGDMEIDYASHAQRAAIEKLIGDNFFGIPWRGYER